MQPCAAHAMASSTARFPQRAAVPIPVIAVIAVVAVVDGHAIESSRRTSTSTRPPRPVDEPRGMPRPAANTSRPSARAMHAGLRYAPSLAAREASSSDFARISL